MIKRYIRNNRPAFFSRLSNLIILQILFVFVAFGLFFLYPVEEQINTTNLLKIEEKFYSIAEKVKVAYQENDLNSTGELLESDFKSSFEQLDYCCCNIYILNNEETLESLYQSSHNHPNQIKNFDGQFILAELLKKEDHLVQNTPSTKKILYYFTFDLTPTEKALIAAEFEHHYFVTSENKVLYTFGLLFLGAILISLLTVYLLNKRIREPLERIMNGLEKTTQGELFYMVETDKDLELNKLTESFNNMSRTLWHNDQKLKKYNQNLIESNSKLIASKEFLHKVLHNSTSAIITTTPQGVIEIFNDTALEHFDMSDEKAKGMQVMELFTDEFDFDKFDDNSENEIEVVCKRTDSTRFPAFVSLAPIYDSESKVVSHLYVIRDISESKLIHNMMIRMDRYYTKGEMAGDIAHEINNFLAILSGNIELMPLLLKKNDPEKISKKLDLMKKQVDRIVNFTDGLLEANDGDESFVQVDINQLLEAVKSFLQPQNLFDFIEIKTNLDYEIPLVDTNIGQIRQLFVNLIYNAGEALIENEDEKKIEVTSELSGDDNNKTVTITVKDNGSGVAPDNIAYLFNKRFTTKSHGHGISLVACKKIIDTHSGSIAYINDDGALFTIILPIKQSVESSSDTNNSDSNIVYA